MKLVFLHGAGSSSLAYYYQLRHFRNSKAIDLPGHSTGEPCPDIEGYLESKINSLSKHASQMSGRPVDRPERIRRWASHSAEATGLPYAEAFRRLRMDLGSLAWQYLNS